MHLLVTGVARGARHAGPDLPGIGDVAAWWRSAVPSARVTTRLLSDGRAGFLDALAGVAADVVSLPVPGVGHVPVRSDGRGTVYVAASGIDAPRQTRGREERGPEPTRAVGRVLAAVAPTVDRIVLATGGARGHDGGAGLVAELARAGGCDLPPAADGEPSTIALLSSISAEEAEGVLRAARAALGGADLVAAVDDDLPLLGLHGATARLGERPRPAGGRSGPPGAPAAAGLAPAAAQDLERELGAFAHRMGAAATALDAARGLRLATSGRERPAKYAALPGAGAGGGLGHGVALLGGRLVPAVRLVGDAVGLDADLAGADLVVVLVDDLDAHEMATGAVPEVAGRAAALAVPVVVLTGVSRAGRREWSAAGVSAVYELGEDPAGRVRRVAATWSGAWSGP